MKNIAVLALVLFLSTTLYASAQLYSTAEEVVAAMDTVPEPESQSVEISMVITSGSGQSLSRSMQSWSKGDNSIVKFTAPADIEGSGFLTLTDDDGEEEGYLWLPALGRVRRLATSGDDQDGAFFGSDFTYEDLNGIETDEYDFELLEVTDDNVYVLKAVIKEEFISQYDWIIISVEEENLVTSKSEYYIDEELTKVLTISEIEKIGDYVLPRGLKMENMDSGSFTTIEQSEYVLDEDVPDEVFSERFLRR